MTFVESEQACVGEKLPSFKFSLINIVEINCHSGYSFWRSSVCSFLVLCFQFMQCVVGVENVMFEKDLYFSVLFI